MEFYPLLRNILADSGIFLDQRPTPQRLEEVELGPVTLNGVKQRLASEMKASPLFIGNCASTTVWELLGRLKSYYNP